MDKCVNIGKEAARNAGFNNTQVQKGGNFSAVFGVNTNDYKLQFVCVPAKTISYVIITGPDATKQVEIREDFAKYFKGLVKQ